MPEQMGKELQISTELQKQAGYEDWPSDELRETRKLVESLLADPEARRIPVWFEKDDQKFKGYAFNGETNGKPDGTYVIVIPNEEVGLIAHTDRNKVITAVLAYDNNPPIQDSSALYYDLIRQKS